MDYIKELEKEQIVALNKTVPDFGPGDTVRVNVRVREGSRERIQAFEGRCIGRSGAGINESFTVRKQTSNEWVERVFPIYSPLVDSIEVIRRGRVRRAKLYYLRGRQGKAARIAEKQDKRPPKAKGQARTAPRAKQSEAAAPGPDTAE